MAKRRVIRYSKPNIARNIKSVSKNIKKNVPVVKRTPTKSAPKTPDRTTMSKEDIEKNPDIKNVNLLKKIPQAKNKKCFIVGGGPSLSGFDFSILQGHDVIAVNKSIEFLDNVKYFVTMDYTFLKKTDLTIEEIKEKAENSIFVLNTGHDYIKRKNGVFTDTRMNYQYIDLYKFDGVVTSPKAYDTKTGFGVDAKNFCNGSNSGYCAVQLALLAGYEEIYLLGFDLTIDSKKSHFHKGYRQNISTFNRNLANYRANFAKSIQISKTDKLISLSPGSYLNTFITNLPVHKSFRNNEPIGHKQDNKPAKKKATGDLRDLMIVGYYTLNTDYEKEARKLIKSLDRLNLRRDIVGVPNLGNWQANTRFKAQFMLDMLDKHPDCRLLYVDCDAIVHKRPVLFTNYQCDVAVRWQDFRWRKNECLSGTIYMENNAKTRQLCKMWLATNDKEGDKAKTFEQWNLGSAIEKMRKEDGLVSKNLPPEYTFIFDSMRKLYPNAVPVIEHFQASRRLRNKV